MYYLFQKTQEEYQRTGKDYRINLESILYYINNEYYYEPLSYFVSVYLENPAIFFLKEYYSIRKMDLVIKFYLRYTGKDLYQAFTDALLIISEQPQKLKFNYINPEYVSEFVKEGLSVDLIRKHGDNPIVKRWLDSLINDI